MGLDEVKACKTEVYQKTLIRDLRLFCPPRSHESPSAPENLPPYVSQSICRPDPVGAGRSTLLKDFFVHAMEVVQAQLQGNLV